MLHDAKTDVTSENLSKVLKHSGVDVPSYWPSLLAKALEGRNVGDYL